MTLAATIEADLVTRHPSTLVADPARVVAKLFLPGEEGNEAHSRAGGIAERVLALSDSDVTRLVDSLIATFAPRHLDYTDVLVRHAAVVASRVRAPAPLTTARTLLLGACFTAEYAVEGAAVTNPSAVPHPDQSGLDAGALRVVFSLRAVGEGHLSSIGFGVGVVGPGPRLRLEPRRGPLTTGRTVPTGWEPARLRAVLAERGLDDEITRAALDVLDGLAARPADGDLGRAFAQVPADLLRRPQALSIIAEVRAVAGSLHQVEFAPDSTLPQRVLWPTLGVESNGMEDARFVRFTASDGGTDYRATYTAYDGRRITPRLLSSPDLRVFTASPLSGPAARNKGMALFPRLVGGRHLALCRSDGETTSIATSADGLAWALGPPVHLPGASFELLQVGNCGSPIETPVGWLVLTHGVGAMRTYTVGAILLDLDDPTVVRATLPEPLLAPNRSESDGYVPNVVYSCGGLVHDGLLWLPYGIADARVGVASVPVAALLARMTPTR